jgi:glyoxylase-like metal-dependent hydrolase (beta-lactamase superfamily II)
MLLVPLAGHSRGHSGVELRTGDGWLLHCGDAYFHHGELTTPPHCPPGLRFFQNLNNADRKQRVANQERLRELAGRHGDEIAFICSHDPDDLDRSRTALAAAG